MSDDLKINLVSKEGDAIEVSFEVAKLSKLVEESCDDEPGENISDIPLPNVKTAVLTKIVEYCQHYKADPMNNITTPLPSTKIEEIVQKWYADFVKVENVMLFELVTASNYMNIQPLLDLTCLAVAVMIKGKSPEEIRSIFNISNEFSPEEEAAVQEENKWCEQAQAAPSTN
mmetsp:Transcript_1810/g.2415  ORF Transcript_1810/g.2415 Transcript_1810/m.2415 type:complete len:172 (+) Transcript_1810:120-635(+)|eukprot:CAMPEP_0116058480 /NCGR_PEP_ID=MMETSP0322-20121206/5222_1 /TAXON_ID=163516 /ORGANISM="Leptocylindrus danicus var. apora, Strain B651" /LENGTH=171 /DNA_ID=CAMNT_0003542671 /DNA_START=248 /DNA_END=763 /DNA_ORIENTATION=+